MCSKVQVFKSSSVQVFKCSIFIPNSYHPELSNYRIPDFSTCIPSSITRIIINGN